MYFWYDFRAAFTALVIFVLAMLLAQYLMQDTLEIKYWLFLITLAIVSGVRDSR